MLPSSCIISHKEKPGSPVSGSKQVTCSELDNPAVCTLGEEEGMDEGITMEKGGNIDYGYKSAPVPPSYPDLQADVNCSELQWHLRFLCCKLLELPPSLL